jgi:hypothetical protein
MRRCWALLFLLPCVALAQSGQRFRVSLPLNTKPETVLIKTGVSGRGLVLNEVRTKPGVYDYSLDLGLSDVGPAQSLKLLIYIPGYRMVTAEFKDADLRTGKTFIPPLFPLPTTPVKGRLLDSAEKPLSDQTLTAGYHLSEAMAYFGYGDGSVPFISFGTVKTDSKGEFTFNVPSLPEDSFFQLNDRSPFGRVQLLSDDGMIFQDQTLTPDSLPAQKTYEPLVIRKTRQATLSGKLGKDFFQQNNLTANLRVELRAEARAGESSLNAGLQPDGSFEVQLPPGEYDLVLWVPGTNRKILVENGVAVAENGRKVIERP